MRGYQDAKGFLFSDRIWHRGGGSEVGGREGGRGDSKHTRTSHAGIAHIENNALGTSGIFHI